ASRDAGVTMQMVGEQLGITDQFLGVDVLTVQGDGSFKVLERIEGGQYQVSECAVAPALQKAQPAQVGASGVTYLGVELPSQRRETRIVKDLSADEVAREIVAWL